MGRGGLQKTQFQFENFLNPGGHTVPKGDVRLFGVPESGKDIFSLHISPKLEIKLNQNPRSSCISTN